MATQMIDGTWSGTEPLKEALETFLNAFEVGTAKRFIAGTEQEIEEEKNEIKTGEELSEIKERLSMLEAVADQSMVAIPTVKEIHEYTQ